PARAMNATPDPSDSHSVDPISVNACPRDDSSPFSPIVTSLALRAALFLTWVASRAPSGDHDTPTKRPGAKNSGARRTASARGLEPSTPATMTALALGSGYSARK